MKRYNDMLVQFWHDYAVLVLFGAGLLGFLALLGLALWAKRSKRPLRPVALAVSMNLALLLNAEGMWVIAVEQLNLPKVFAVLVFAVFEICFLTATSLAAEQYRRTTVHGPDGEIVTPGHPGAMLYIAALIAVVSGVIVASSAVTGTEKLLRLAVPCVIFLMWWAALTAAGQRVRRGRFAYSPRRLAERWGWLIPDDDPDLVRMAAERQARRMVVNHHRVAAGRWPKAWWRSRLLKDARTAGEPVVDEVLGQLRRIDRVMALLAPGALDGYAVAQPGPNGSARARVEDDARAPGLPSPGSMGSAVARTTAPTPAPVDRPIAVGPGEPVGGSAAAVPPLSRVNVGGDLAPRFEAGHPALAVPHDEGAVAPIPIPIPAPRRAEGPPPATPMAPAVPWWRADAERLSELVAEAIGPDDVPEMTYPRIAELTRQLAPQVPDLGGGMVRSYISDYLKALSGQPVDGTYPWDDLLPAPQPIPWTEAPEAAGPATDEELLERYGPQLAEHLRETGRLTRYRVETVTGAKRAQADRIRAAVESRVAVG